jgi:glycosyltransferase involved in cell wall biosynthesis
MTKRKRKKTVTNVTPMLQKGKTISACLVLKNEGSTIYRCLDSMKGFVDEYIIGIDESTDDNTYEEVLRFFKDNTSSMPECIDLKKDANLIIKRFDKHIARYNWATIYPYKWQDDFSKARNEGMDKATGDYILIMDGHEYFPDQWYNITENEMINVKSLLPAIKDVLGKNEIDEGYFQLYQQPFIGMTPNNFFLQPRIYRNGVSKKDGKTKIRFNRAAHNTIVGTDFRNALHFNEIMIIHDAPVDNRTERKKQRVTMNVERIEAAIKKNPKDTRNYFYLGNTLIEKEQYKKAIKAYKNYIKYRKDDTHEKYQVYMHIAICHRNLKQYKEANDALFLAKSIDPLRRDAYALLGDLYLETKQYDKCIFELTTMLKLKTQASRMFQNGAIQRWDPHQKLAVAYEHTGNIPKATAHLQHAYSIFPNPDWLKTIQIWKGNKRNILILDKQRSFTKDIFKHFKDIESYNVVYAKTYDERLAKWADNIWCEWADENAVLCSTYFPKKTVIRLHGYEAYILGHLHNQIKWNDVKKIVFVATHIKDMMVKKVGINKDKCVVIHNGVNIDKFFIKNRKRKGNKIGYAGYINEKKNPFLLIQAIKQNPNLEFNLRIDHQSPFWEKTFEYELKDCKNVVYHGRYNDLNDFWNKMDAVISTSIIESFSYNVAEAMACGCQPFVYNWNGAKEFWGGYVIYRVDNLTESIEYMDIPLDEMRKYIVDNFNYKDKLIEIEKVLIDDTNVAKEL